MTTSTNERPLWANAWHGEQVLKEEILSDLRDDLEHDRMEQGAYLEGARHVGSGEFKGCHIGCLFMAKERYRRRRARRGAILDPLDQIASKLAEKATTWHEKVPEELGMPTALAYFWDKMFEDMPAELAPRWVFESMECIPVGADLSNVLAELIIWLIADEQHGFLRTTLYPVTPAEERVRARAEQVVAAWRQRIARPDVSPHYGLTDPEIVALADAGESLGYSVTGSDISAPFGYLVTALYSAQGAAAVHHVAKGVIFSYVDAVANEALPIAEPNDAFEPADDFLDVDLSGRAWWLVARQFFALCAAAPSQGPAQ